MGVTAMLLLVCHSTLGITLGKLSFYTWYYTWQIVILHLVQCSTLGCLVCHTACCRKNFTVNELAV